jgi:hypothetical protein
VSRRTDYDIGPRARALSSIAIVVLLAGMVVANLPPSSARTRLMKVDGPFLTAIGARQVWSVFAPDPAQTVIRTVVLFRYADGSSGSWRLAKRNPVLGSYRDYRWLKLGENAELPNVGPGLLDWVVRHEAGRKRVVQAALVRYWRPIPPPGTPAGRHSPEHRDVMAVEVPGPSG